MKKGYRLTESPQRPLPSSPIQSGRLLSFISILREGSVGSANEASGVGHHTGWFALYPMNSWVTQTPSISRGDPRPEPPGHSEAARRGHLPLQKRGGAGGLQGKSSRSSMGAGAGQASGFQGTLRGGAAGRHPAPPETETEGRAQSWSCPPRNAIHQPPFPAHTGHP